MSYDLKRSHFSLILERGVTDGLTITEEGQALIAVIDQATGTEKVQSSGGDSGEIFAGFSIRDNADNATTSVVEEIVVPSVAPFTASLSNTNIVAGTVGVSTTAALRAVASDTGLLAKTDSVPNTGEIQILSPATVVTGDLVFHEDEAGQTVTVTYRFNLTVAQSRLEFFQRNINNEAGALFGQVGVGMGNGEVFTDQFDATLAWDAGEVITTGADGILTQGGNGAKLDARVISVPNVNNPLLGINFNVGGGEGTPA